MYQKILLPLDGSVLAEGALFHVKEMVKENSTMAVILLNVVDNRPIASAEGFDAGVIEKAQFNLSQRYLDNLQCRLRAEGIEVKTEIIKGSAAQAISDYAHRKGVDLIVIATHGYTGMKRLMFGSVALSVLHDSHTPVLLIRPESGGKGRRAKRDAKGDA